MKTFIFTAFFACFAGPVAFASSCPKSSEKNQLNSTRDQLQAYKPPAPAQGGATGNQTGDMGAGKKNAGNAAGAAAACANTLRGFEKKFKDLKDKFGDPNCSEEKNEAEKQEQAAAAKAAECEAAGAAANKQEDKNKDNEKKMGGEGKPPEMPKPPEKKEEKKEDPAAKERERQAKIKECKARVNNALEIKKRNCESQFPYNPAYPVANMKQQQDDCKQTMIFANQSELSQCDYDPNTQTAPVKPFVPTSGSTSSSTATHTSSTITTQTSTATSTATQ